MDESVAFYSLDQKILIDKMIMYIKYEDTTKWIQNIFRLKDKICDYWGIGLRNETN